MDKEETKQMMALGFEPVSRASMRRLQKMGLPCLAFIYS